MEVAAKFIKLTRLQFHSLSHFGQQAFLQLSFEKWQLASCSKAADI
jgi:hypothetical protein